MTDYVVKRVTEPNIYGLVYQFYLEEWENVCKIFGHEFDRERFDFVRYALDNLLLVCFYRSYPIGILMARLYPSVWDSGKKVLFQDLLYCKKSKTRAPHLLLREFIDFGRANANLVFTCRTPYTNIKEHSLEKLGFKKTEELYLLGK